MNLQRAEVRGDLLETVATLNAVQGRITTARSQIKDAVEAKFGVRIAEREAQIENVNLLLASGILDREETKRVEAVKAQAELQQAEDEAEKQVKIDISEAVFNEDVLAILSEQANGSQVIENALNAGSVDEANQILFEAGAFVAEEEKNLQFIPGTANQPAGIFNKDTGTFTATGGGGVSGDTIPSEFANVGT